MKNNNKGETTVIILLIIAIIGGSLAITKPKFLDGDSKRAEQSAKTTERLDAATTAQGANAAASIAKIGEANSAAPDSPAKEFIRREVPYALSLLPAPSATALLEAEKRRVAVMEGKVDEARRLYESASKQAAQLQTERDAALAARRSADKALAEEAAARLAAERQANRFIIACIVLVLIAAYIKFYSITPAALGSAAAGIRAGEDPIAALDRVIAPWLHSRIQTAAKLATDIDKPKNPTT